MLVVRPSSFLACVMAVIISASSSAKNPPNQGRQEATENRAKYSWQKMQMPTAAQVSATWRNPPPEYGPEPYFDMSGSVDQAEIQRDLDAMKALGFRAVTPQAGVGMPFDYLSPEYFKFFQMLVAEAKKRDMRVWIVDDIGYPSGFAGGRFTREKPELRMQTLSVAERIAVEGGSTLRRSIPRETVAVTAIGDDQSTITVPVNNRSEERRVGKDLTS